nr:MAG TPA: hypothetical protein [Bacteriophage sp.]
MRSFISIWFTSCLHIKYTRHLKKSQEFFKFIKNKA